MAEMTYRDALNMALKEEMRRDPSVVTWGEDVALYEGSFKVTRGLLAEFGGERVKDTPISENTIIGVAVGAAMGGLRPIAELMTVNFALLAMDQLVNHMSKIRYMFGGKIELPIVVRAPGGGGSQLGAQHSQSLESYFMHCPGIYLALPATPADAKGLLKTAIRENNPVMFLEHELLYNSKGEVPENDDFTIPHGCRGAGEGGGIVRGRRSADSEPAGYRHVHRLSEKDRPRRRRFRMLADLWCGGRNCGTPLRELFRYAACSGAKGFRTGRSDAVLPQDRKALHPASG